MTARGESTAASGNRPASPVPGTDTACASGAIREAIRTLLEDREAAEPVTAGGSLLFDPDRLLTFYERRGFMPAWCGPHGPNQEAEAMIRAIRAAADEGLQSRAYHLDAVAATLTRVQPGNRVDTSDLVALDLLLSDVFLVYARPTSCQAGWIRRGFTRSGRPRLESGIW